MSASNIPSLLPERPLVISPTLAATIGLEEAVMLQSLADVISQRANVTRHASALKWVELNAQDFRVLFPFWAAIDIRRVQASLQNLGLIIIEAIPNSEDAFYIAVDDSSAQTSRTAAAPQYSSGNAQAASSAAPPKPQPAVKPGSATLIASNWQPDDTWIQQCRQHNIPDHFINALVPEFIGYWRDRGQARFSWGNAFYKHVLKEWRNEQTRVGKYELSTQMSESWRPSQDAIEILENSGVSGSFLEDAIPEFVLYWRERGMVNGAWNTKFIEHIRRQWAKYSASFGRDDTPKIIPSDWQPSADCFEVLALAEIDEDYARGRVPEFVLYWRDSQQVKSSWNTVFLQFIKQDWARRLKNQSTEESYGENQPFAGSSQQRIKERFQKIADRSWAD
ncbi:MAG: DnaT-like ssDNA-binding domain-containing protein [Pseudohongiellaceae bacterium]